MTEQQLKDTIIAQAVRIAEPEEELASENWMSNYYRKECSELRDKIAKLRNQQTDKPRRSNVSIMFANDADIPGMGKE